ncbi:DMT family transporter [Sphingobacterium suaedae]|uniref:DMT family transporter n=1 Tax=Sphingobacterium suaedae TaxID=1686402 RepID=A0ABW5KL74_9SPHI
MKIAEHRDSSETAHGSVRGWINGFIGVLLFSGSLPATRVAVLELDPIFLTAARAAIAAILAIMVLFICGQKRPKRSEIYSIAVVSVGCVVGFPLLSALALQHVTSAHSMVFVGLLPLATAVFGVLRGGERPTLLFWIFSILGGLLVTGYAIAQGSTFSPVGDALMIAAIVVCGLGYAEGARLAKTLGGWQVISWALVLSAPIVVVLAILYLPTSLIAIRIDTWIALGYVSFFSMFIGFIFWYRGLALGGIASVGQLQLLQPLFGLGLAAGLLHEEVGWEMVVVTLGVILCVAASRRFAR